MRVALVGPLDIPPLAAVLEDAPDPLPSGPGGTSITQLALGLVRAGHDVTVITLDSGVDDRLRLHGPRLQIDIGACRERHRARDGFRVERAHVTAALADYDVDIVHAHWTYEFALGALALGGPTVITVRDWAPTILRLMPTPYRLVRLLLNVATLARGQHFTAPSPYICDRLRGWHRCASLIPNALDDEVFTQRTADPDTAAPLLLAINNGFSRYKNVGVLLQAFARVRARRPAARLLLIGDGYGPDGPAASWARAEGIDAGVIFHGPAPHATVLDFLRHADLFVHPSREESFGLVLLEAMAQGLPVVGGADSGAVPWVLDDGRAGVLADVRSPAALGAAIDSVLDEPGRWWHLSRSGHAHAFDRFRLSRVVEQYVTLYERVLERAPATMRTQG